MRTLILSCALLGFTGLSADRFHADPDRTERIFDDFNLQLLGLCKQVEELKYINSQMLDYLKRIHGIAIDYKVDSWNSSKTGS